jgi:hypothetical protein
MKHALWIIIALLFCNTTTIYPDENSRDPKNDDYYQKLIPGLWSIDRQVSDTYMKGTVTFLNDKTFVTSGTLVHNDNTLRFSYKGYWRIENNSIIETITYSTTPLVQTGITTRDSILQMDDIKMVYKTSGGHVILRMRIQQK